VTRKYISSFFALALFTASLAVVPAYGQSKSDSWEYTATLNLWGAGVQGTTQSGAVIDISFSDILDNLDFTFMGTFEARKAKWSLLADMVYLNMSADQSGNLPGPGGALARLDVGVEGVVLGLGAGYNLADTERGVHDFVFGARYLNLDTSLKFTIGERNAGTSESGGIWDGIVGFRGRANLQGKWYLPYYVDIGTGQSDMTWQALAGVGYKYNWGDLVFSYRHLEWEFDADSPIKDINFSGPNVQFKWYF
jgi:hypothetical protein